MTDEIKPNKRSGRPRSEQSKEAILNTTWKLLQAGTVKDLSIEAIAREAGVGKTTIYRWWSSKAAVIVDAFMAQVEPEIPATEVESAIVALKEQVTLLIKAFRGDNGRIVAEIIAEGQASSEALKSFRDRFILPRREAASSLIEKGIKLGEFDESLNPELALDVLYGSLYYRLMVGHLPIDDDFAEHLPDVVMKGLAKRN
ncbi:TetR family transcriptional regulator [Dulcicalothrix desertica PCC 7102]|uniref:TetR family transcriptional regulator n=1 Tax=Dulcicalothrix desertica PCC 7102 TaxID=232991 RepID=A0A433VBC2_9CYAN|nr:TetR/AcrR family transcriptional regulator [Dulcicalothrix desertica]RUT03405.1 TetR family transcriptional regulator [Dulcicalothrix desertica PCC 7102]TWH50670.1 TetR family transcriptional regulator [Dulcicalothrix desertica PCC 7102]